MELGIEGRRALVCGASKGLGFACALALAHEGVRTTLVARDQAALTSAADQIQSTTGQPCHSIAADLSTADGRGRVSRYPCDECRRPAGQGLHGALPRRLAEGLSAKPPFAHVRPCPEGVGKSPLYLAYLTLRVRQCSPMVAHQ